ncbi:MAG: SPFH domain-containing protein [Spirochaetota bacterium]
MLYYARVFAILLFVSSLFYVLNTVIFRVLPGEALAVISKTGKNVRIYSEPGLVLVPDFFFPAKLHLSRFSLKEKRDSFTLRHSLLEEFFPGKLPIVVSYTYSYRMQPRTLQQFYQEKTSSAKSVREHLQEIFAQETHRYLYTFQEPTQWGKIREAFTGEGLQQLLQKIQRQASGNGYLVRNLQILRTTFPSAALLNSLQKNTKQDIEQFSQKKLARLQGELFAIEEIQRDEAYFERLEKTAKFLQKYPHMKQYTLYNKMSQNAGTLILGNTPLPDLSQRVAPKGTPKKKLRIVE